LPHRAILSLNLRFYAGIKANTVTELKVAMVERTMPICRPAFDPTTTRQASQSAVEMSPQMKRVLRFFDEYVFGFMRSDIDAAIRGNANYLCALAVVHGGHANGLIVWKNGKGKTLKEIESV